MRRREGKCFFLNQNKFYLQKMLNRNANEKREGNVRLAWCIFLRKLNKPEHWFEVKKKFHHAEFSKNTNKFNLFFKK